MTSLSLTEQLAKHLLRPVDEATRARARLHLLDWLACVAGARGSAVSRTFDTVFATAITTKIAMLGNVLEMDDVHRQALIHPGPVIWPAALGSGKPAPLTEYLDAAIRGYDAMICVGATFDARHYANFHPTSTAGCFGTAATASNLLGLCEQATANALALAGSVTGGFWQMRHKPY